LDQALIMALRGITDPTLSAPLLEPDSLETDPMISFEQGGIALNDPSAGRLYQTWRLYLDAGVVKVSPISGTPVTTLFTPTGVVTSLSLGFDSNMVPTVAYMEDGAAKLRWFNTVSGLIQTDTYTATACKCGTDEKRSGLEGLSDVIFAYLRAGNLYYRQQRDRYLIEYTVGAVGASFKLRRVGKNVGNRFQFELST
jgi:hypothetical protein